MIVAGHRHSGFKTDVLRGRGWYALSGLGADPAAEQWIPLGVVLVLVLFLM